MIKPRMLGHLVIRVRDAQRSEDFYTNVLGLEVRNRTRGGKMRFFTSNPEIDHELAVAEIVEDAVGPSRTRSAYIIWPGNWPTWTSSKMPSKWCWTTTSI